MSARYEELTGSFSGPVIPLPTPFDQDYNVDYASLDSYVRFLVDGGIPAVMTTVGTSRFNLLTVDEMLKINETVVAAAEGKTKTIVSTPMTGSTRQCIEFGKHAEKIGADILLVYHPERHYGEEALFEFFNAIAAELDIALMIHEMPMRNGVGGGSVQYSIPLLQRLLDIPSLVGMKEEALDPPYSDAIVKATSDRAIIIGAGGGMSRYLRDYWNGARAFLGGIGNFYPKLELDFFTAMQNQDFKQAHEIVYNIEKPYFSHVVPMGWHIALKEALHIKGFLPPYERPPLRRVFPEQRELIKSLLQSNGWL